MKNLARRIEHLKRLLEKCRFRVLTLSYVYLGASVQIIRWSLFSSMKNVGVAWRLRDVVKEWQKLKKMMNVLLHIQVLKVSV